MKAGYGALDLPRGRIVITAIVLLHYGGPTMAGSALFCDRQRLRSLGACTSSVRTGVLSTGLRLRGGAEEEENEWNEMLGSFGSLSTREVRRVELRQRMQPALTT